MDYESHRHYPSSSLAYSPYFFSERNIPLAIPHVSRADPRGYPVGSPVGGLRARAGAGSEHTTTENGQIRRRVALACARCRKRKIRCSGDPGNGTGCQNCKQAGVDLNQCQFQRVGSQDPNTILALSGITQLVNAPSNLPNSNPILPIYNVAGSAIYSRPMSATQYSHLDTKSAFQQQTWAIPYAEDTSPVEAYSLNHPGTYLPNQNTLANLYGDSYRWNQAQQRALQVGSGAYLQSDTSASYPNHSLPFITTANMRGAVSNDTFSPLNMTSLQSTLPVSLPERSQPRQNQVAKSPTPKRQLPIPQPSPAQASRNVVDQMQDQRLRSTQSVTSTPQIVNGTFTKPAMAWNGEGAGSDISSNVSVETSSTEAGAQSSQAIAITDIPSNSVAFMPATTPINEETADTTVQPQLNFSSTPLLEVIPASAMNTTYSNFRNYNLPMPSSTETLPLLARQNPEGNHYSYSSDHGTKRNSLCSTSSEATLVSGQRYAPLGQAPPQRTDNAGALQKDSFEARNSALQQSPISSLNHSY
ncbi:hypothetical protein CC78DRAFT_21609 [Lojkania enalia]|uniref:Zn(2)-C6 fungal-type domain-containing protein n=1 Tax=Lojkania enalia TaxID=147567 RepID=A0A9P4N875_9PLEO|nr:hypothetical protein CC78DRAFT_21609 [Didymosphaeria enalia]